MSNAANPGGAVVYRSDIDGLRAVAVLPVVFYHAGLPWFSGGFVGVDVFFVISGYLITSILLAEIERGDFRIRHFYERRARRLFPALFAVMLCSTVAAVLLLMPEELEDFGESVATTALFVSNFLFFTEAGYFAGPAELKPLLHTWSLAIEEQYYLLFPGFLLLIARYGARRYLPWVAGLLVVSFAVSAWSVSRAPDAAFYLLPSRTWELMVGSVVAIGVTLDGWQIRRKLLRAAGSLLGLALILTAVFGLSAATPFPGAAALLPCVGTALIILCGHNAAPGMVGKLLSLKPVVFVGLISYSLYLWHWPVLVFARHYFVRPLELAEALLLVVLSFVAAVISWRFIERPFRGRKGWLDSRGLFRAAGVTMGVAVAAGLVLERSEGFPGRLPDAVRAVAEVAEQRPQRRDTCEGLTPAQMTLAQICRVNDLEAAPSFVLWGDSHAMMAVDAVGRAAARVNRNGLVLVTNGCAPLLDVYRPARRRTDCREFNAAVVQLVADHPHLETVVLFARWARHADGTPFGDEGGAAMFLADAGGVAASVEENRQMFSAALLRTLDALHALERRIVLLDAVPEAGLEVPNTLAKLQWRERALPEGQPRSRFTARQQGVQAAFDAAREAFPVEIVALAQRLCDEQFCALADADGLPLYFDDNHLSRAGVARLQAPLDRLFQIQHFQIQH